LLETSIDSIPVVAHPPKLYRVSEHAWSRFNKCNFCSGARITRRIKYRNGQPKKGVLGLILLIAPQMQPGLEVQALGGVVGLIEYTSVPKGSVWPCFIAERSNNRSL
jgi:hypothetical protein